jgi:5-(carboxyamino)imidazole ribonucleotide synthase
MKQVCVLGNGQLGRMLRQAGEPLGISVWPVGLDAEPEAVPFHQSVITAEIERWPETALTRELARHNAFVNRDVFPIIADRLTQKQLFDKLGLRPRRGSCCPIKANGTTCLPCSANWRL